MLHTARALRSRASAQHASLAMSPAGSCEHAATAMGAAAVGRRPARSPSVSGLWGRVLHLTSVGVAATMSHSKTPFRYA